MNVVKAAQDNIDEDILEEHNKIQDLEKQILASERRLVILLGIKRQIEKIDALNISEESPPVGTT